MVPSPEDDDFVWPSISDITASQQKCVARRPKRTRRQGNLHLVLSTTWIPDEDVDLQLRLLVVAHCGISGHRLAESTEAILRVQFTWTTLKDDVREFVGNCIHSMMAKSELKIPRPIAETIQAVAPNDVIHCNFLYWEQAPMDTSTYS